jgi:DHA1 family bicyclomycin/chloramphenicol resistance-like MFS transporter
LVGPLVLYVTGLAVMMPAITVLALDCLPTHRGTAASMQGFLQSVTNAAVASVAVPLLNTRWLDFVTGQLVFFLVAAGLWFYLRWTSPQQ